MTSRTATETSTQTMSATPRLPAICSSCDGHGVIRSPRPNHTSLRRNGGSVVAVLRCGTCMGHGVPVPARDRDFTLSWSV